MSVEGELAVREWVVVVGVVGLANKVEGKLNSTETLLQGCHRFSWTKPNLVTASTFQDFFAL